MTRTIGDWSYNGDPTASNRNRVRWLCGDTDPDDKLVGDREIDAALTVHASNVYAAAAEVCDHLARRCAREADRSVSASGGASVSNALSQRSRSYQAMARDLRFQIALSVTPYAGGISRTDKDARAEDSDRVAPAFWREQFDVDTALTDDPSHAIRG